MAVMLLFTNDQAVIIADVFMLSWLTENYNLKYQQVNKK
jgi:hypothetical protein